jgi:hypothetical protein
MLLKLQHPNLFARFSKATHYFVIKTRDYQILSFGQFKTNFIVIFIIVMISFGT